MKKADLKAQVRALQMEVELDRQEIAIRREQVKQLSKACVTAALEIADLYSKRP